MIWGETKTTLSYWGVRVTEGKITVNVWWKSRRKWFWFEIAQGSRYQESTVIFSHTINSYMYKQWTNDNYLVTYIFVWTNSIFALWHYSNYTVIASSLGENNNKKKLLWAMYPMRFVGHRCFMLETPDLHVFFISFLLNAKIHFSWLL